jgi:hypothetical protein
MSDTNNARTKWMILGFVGAVIVGCLCIVPAMKTEPNEVFKGLAASIQAYNELPTTKSKVYAHVSKDNFSLSLPAELLGDDQQTLWMDRARERAKVESWKMPSSASMAYIRFLTGKSESIEYAAVGFKDNDTQKEMEIVMYCEETRHSTKKWVDDWKDFFDKKVAKENPPPPPTAPIPKFKGLPPAPR